MKAKVIKGYPDKITNKWYNEGTIVEFDEKRIQELVEKGIVEIYKESKKNKEQEISD